MRLDIKALHGKSNSTGSMDILTAFTRRVCFSSVSKSAL